jgi:hypothetical protein
LRQKSTACASPGLVRQLAARCVQDELPVLTVRSVWTGVSRPKEQVMNVVDHAEMHRDHCQMRSEDDLWRLEIAAWQHELETAAKELSKLKAAPKEHEKALQTHAAAIRAYEGDAGEHEHALAAFERGGSGGELIDMAKAHSEEISQHERRRQTHERIKRHHHCLMAHWKLLVKAMGREL